MDDAKFPSYYAGYRVFIDAQAVQFIELALMKMSDQYSWWSELLHPAEEGKR